MSSDAFDNIRKLIFYHSCIDLDIGKRVIIRTLFLSKLTHIGTSTVYVESVVTLLLINKPNILVFSYTKCIYQQVNCCAPRPQDVKSAKAVSRNPSGINFHNLRRPGDARRV